MLYMQHATVKSFPPNVVTRMCTS